MNENLNSINSINNTSRRNRRLPICALLAALTITTSCWFEQTAIDLQNKQLKHLENKLKKQADHYKTVAIQQNIQQDLKEEWADLTINQEIGYAINWADKQDTKISKTKKQIKRAQTRLFNMEENLWQSHNEEDTENIEYNERLNTEKYDYIDKQYKRAWKAKNNQ